MKCLILKGFWAPNPAIRYIFCWAKAQTDITIIVTSAEADGY